MKQLALLLTQKLRQSVQHASDEVPRNEKVNRKVTMLHHGLVISNWVQSFDPENINDVFDNSQLPLSDKVKLAQSQSIDDLRKIGKMALSPSKAHLNQVVRGGSKAI